MIRVGVTGGIGSGKSTVCEIFALLGVPVYDSDRRARELMQEGELRQQIEALFGTSDRSYIAAKVFEDKSLLASLEALVHPVVAKDFEAWTQKQARRQETTSYAVLESAILFESGFNKLMDRVITVSAPIETRLERIVTRSGALTREQARQRMAAQMTDSERETKADYVIDNCGTLSELAAQVEEIDKLLKQ